MKKLIATFLISASLGSGAILSGCAAENPMITEEDLSVKSHFYPIVNGSKYTYVRYNNDSDYDTITYQVKVGQKRGDMNYLDRIDSGYSAPQVLYYFTYANDQFGQPAAVLKDTAQFFALAGNLEKNGNPWLAKTEPRIWAQVVEVYDQYVVNGNISFSEVIAVKYWPEGKEETDYTHRWYAKNYGLIRERKVVGSRTELGTLQLIAKSDSYGNWIRQDDPPREHRLGKYRSVMMSQEEWDLLHQ
ncbi:MAG TPA: hypothetical protein VFH43_11390 [Candidatus Kapabacteria bacterium]|nr:hypothetical protein [Candidatus Kapabacteria bacterium]